MIDRIKLKREIDKILKPMWHIGVSIQKPNVENILNTEDVKLNRQQLMNLIDQIDEPEQTDTNVGLLKPVIPQIVADWIKKEKIKGRGLASAISYLIAYGWDDDAHSDFISYKYLKTNEEDFIRAWLAYPNIEVEQQKLYRVKLPDGENKPDKFFALVKRDECITIERVKANKYKYEKVYRLTEDEISLNHEYLWEFAEPVENK